MGMCSIDIISNEMASAKLSAKMPPRFPAGKKGGTCMANAVNVVNEENTRNVVRNYKDSVFRMLFREKKDY